MLVKVATPRNKMYPHVQSNGTIFVEAARGLSCVCAAGFGRAAAFVPVSSGFCLMML